MHLLADKKPLEAISLPRESPFKYSATVTEKARVEWMAGEHPLHFGFNRTLKNLDFNKFRLLFSSVFTLRILSVANCLGVVFPVGGAPSGTAVSCVWQAEERRLRPGQ